MSANEYFNYPRGYQPPVVPGHQHRASCHGPIGELQCGHQPPVIDDLTGRQKEIMDNLAPVKVKPQLHWYQWIVYTIVLITCLAVLYGMLETWLMVQSIQDAAERFANGLEGNL